MTPPIVVDANVFLRYLVRAETPRDVEYAAEAAALFDNCEQGQLDITTNSAIIAEVVFILASARHYALSRSDVASRLAPLLQIPGCILPDKDLILHALERWQGSKQLSFVDSLIIEQALVNDAPLASSTARSGKPQASSSGETTKRRLEVVLLLIGGFDAISCRSCLHLRSKRRHCQ